MENSSNSVDDSSNPRSNSSNATNPTPGGGFVAALPFCVMLLISVFEIAGNGMILLSLRQAKRFSRSTRYLIGNLACADMAFGVVHGIKVIFTLAGATNTVSCVVLGLGLMVFGNISVLGVCFIFVDCYRSISKTHGNVIPMKYGSFGVGFSWVFCILFSTLCLINPGASTIKPDECSVSHKFYNNGFLLWLWLLLTANFALTFIAMVLTIRALRRSLRGLFQGDSNGASARANDMKRRSLQKQSKVINLFVIIMIGIVVSWGPLYGGMMASSLFDSYGVDHTVIPVLAAFTPINSCVNVVVYAVKDEAFRKAFVMILRCKPNQIQADTSIASARIASATRGK